MLEWTTLTGAMRPRVFVPAPGARTVVRRVGPAQHGPARRILINADVAAQRAATRGFERVVPHFAWWTRPPPVSVAGVRAFGT